MGIEYVSSLALLSQNQSTTALQNITHSVLSPYSSNVISQASPESDRLNREALNPHEQIDPKKEMQAAGDDFESRVFYQSSDGGDKGEQNREDFDKSVQRQRIQASFVEEAWEALLSDEEENELKFNLVTEAWTYLCQDEIAFTSLSNGSSI